jgi:hypothetical protein
MNRQGQIEAIRAACIAANPEIVKLKFGCEIQPYGVNSPDNIAVILMKNSRGEYELFDKRDQSILIATKDQ